MTTTDTQPTTAGPRWADLRADLRAVLTDPSFIRGADRIALKDLLAGLKTNADWLSYDECNARDLAAWLDALDIPRSRRSGVLGVYVADVAAACAPAPLRRAATGEHADSDLVVDLRSLGGLLTDAALVASTVDTLAPLFGGVVLHTDADSGALVATGTDRYVLVQARLPAHRRGGGDAADPAAAEVVGILPRPVFLPLATAVRPLQTVLSSSPDNNWRDVAGLRLESDSSDPDRRRLTVTSGALGRISVPTEAVPTGWPQLLGKIAHGNTEPADPATVATVTGEGQLRPALLATNVLRPLLGIADRRRHQLTIRPAASTLGPVLIGIGEHVRALAMPCRPGGDTPAADLTTPLSQPPTKPWPFRTPRPTHTTEAAA